MKCYLCESTEFERVQKGVRDNPTINVIKCCKCGLTTLDNFNQITDKFYEESGMHQEKIKIDDWLKITSKDDQRRVDTLKKYITNKRVLDFGAGNCGFINLAKPYTNKIAGIELENQFKKYFKKKNLEIFDSIDDLKNKTVQKFDLITAFHVFEHLKDPKYVLQKLTELLEKDGQIIIEVPNSDDALLSLYKSEKFAKFTYWSQHLFLFNEATAKKLVEKSRLKLNWIKQIQRYPLANHLHWLSKYEPGGHEKWSFLSKKTNESYSLDLAKLKKCDTIIFSVSLN